MPPPTQISPAQLLRLVGLPDAPHLIDIRDDDDFLREPRLLPASQRCRPSELPRWAADHSDCRAVVICRDGLSSSQGAAAWLRHLGIAAESLEGGFAAWAALSAPLIRAEALPTPNSFGSTAWVTRARPKVDRIACPWLIRRFVDRDAIFLFVAPAEVESVGTKFGAVPFDVDGAFWSHRGDLCTFDIMLEQFGLSTPALQRLASIVRGADTARADLAPEAPGLLAASLGLSRMYADDLAQLEAGLSLYDAFYRWCRDATDETHNWPAGHMAGRNTRERVRDE